VNFNISMLIKCAFVGQKNFDMFLESLLLKDPNASAICSSVERNFVGEVLRLWREYTVRANPSSWGEFCPSATCHLD
jgi:hypothetical protein